MEPAHPNTKSNHISKRVRVRVPGRRQRRNYYCLGCNEFGVQFRVNSEGCKMQRWKVDCEGEIRLSVKTISPGSRHRRWACLICNKKTIKAYLSNIISIDCALMGVQDTPAKFQSCLSNEKLCVPLPQLSAGTSSNLLAD